MDVVREHVVPLDEPLRPQNAPDTWERAAEAMVDVRRRFPYHSIHYTFTDTEPAE